MPKPDNYGSNFFSRPEFRGLLLSDGQAALGEQARVQIRQLNETHVNKFTLLETYLNAHM
jgi:hypothetical protein